MAMILLLSLDGRSAGKIDYIGTSGPIQHAGGPREIDMSDRRRIMPVLDRPLPSLDFIRERRFS
jgi:hypothetical protein